MSADFYLYRDDHSSLIHYGLKQEQSEVYLYNGLLPAIEKNKLLHTITWMDLIGIC